MSVTPLHQMAARGGQQQAAARPAVASRQQVASVLVTAIKQRSTTIASLDAAANKVFAAFTAKDKKFSRQSLAKVRGTLAKMEVAAGKLYDSAVAHTRVALARSMPTSKLIAQAADLASLKAKISSLKATADVTLDGVEDENFLLQVDENGYLVDAPNTSAQEVPEVTDPADGTAAVAEVIDSNGETIPGTAATAAGEGGEPSVTDEAPVADDLGDDLDLGLSLDDAPVEDGTAAVAEVTDSNGETIPGVASRATRRQAAEGDDVVVEDDVTDPAAGEGDDVVDPATAADDCLGADDGDLDLDLPDLGIDDIVGDEILTDPAAPAEELSEPAPAAARATARAALRATASRTPAACSAAAASTSADPLSQMMAELIHKD